MILLLRVFFLTGLVFFLQASPVLAEGWCTSVQSPHIRVKTDTDNIQYDFSKSEKDLNHFSIDTVNPYGDSVITDVGGLMQGRINVSQRMKYGTLTNTRTSEICYWYTEVTVSLHVSPTIFVAKEFPKGSCKHKAILDHEHQHVMIDREIVNKYAKMIGDTLYREVSERGVFGPVPLSKSTQLEGQLKKRMELLLTQYSDQINEERRIRQQALDSLSEYERVNKACP